MNDLEYEVVWSGGELLPPRPEGTQPMWRFMLSELEAQMIKRVLSVNEKLHGEGVVHSGRLCACGCGQEMVYAARTKERDRKTIYKTGHQHRVRTDSPWYECEYCQTRYQSQATTAKHCSQRCRMLASEARRSARRAA